MKIYTQISVIPHRTHLESEVRPVPPGNLRRKAPLPTRQAPHTPPMPSRPAPLSPECHLDKPTLFTMCAAAGPAPPSPTGSALFCADDSFRTPLHQAAAGPGGTKLVRALLERCPPARRHELASQIPRIPDGRSLGSPGVAALVYNEDPEDVVGILVALGLAGVPPSEVATEAMGLGVQCQKIVRSWDAYAGLVDRAHKAIAEARASQVMPASPVAVDVTGIEESSLLDIVRHGTRAQIQEKVRRAPALLLRPDRTSHGRNLPVAVALVSRRPDIALFLLKAMDAYQLLEEHPLDTPNVEGDTPLSLAIKLGETGVVRALLQMGAGLRIVTDVGEKPIKRASPFFRRHEAAPPTPFEIAVVNGQAAVLDVLLRAEETALGAPLDNALAKLGDLIAAYPKRDTALALAKVLEDANQRRYRAILK